MANENNIVPRLKVRVLTQSGTLRVKMPNMPNRLGVDIPLLKSVTTDAVLYVPQELNESEQSVARNNIGITDDMYEFISTGDSDNYTIGEKNEGDGGITTTVNVGGVDKGDFIEKDTHLNKLLRDILAPSINPTITMPSATIETSATVAQRLLKVGSSIQPTIWINYNRGNISLDGVVKGHTAGVAMEYAFTDGTEVTEEPDNSISPVIQRNDECVVTYTGSVTYDEGDQPYDSEGKEYGEPLPSGTVNTSNGVSCEFVYPIYANTDAEHLNETYEQPLVSRSRGYFEITFPLQHGGAIDRYTMEIPSTINVTEIKFFNTFAIKYDDDNKLDDFTVTNVIKDGVIYKRYTYNIDVYIESNTFKIIW